jgi:D-threo-aldose 1-dehydrogenase
MIPGETVRIRDIEVGRLALGTAPLGGLFNPVSDDDATATVHRALELGIRSFDTAPLYGYGNAERRLGLGLRSVDRDSVTIETKVGRLLREKRDGDGLELDTTQFHDGEPFYTGTGEAIPVFDFSYDGAMRSLEESLTRLGVDRVDIALVHDPDDHVDIALGGAFRALSELRDQGVVGAIGVGTDYSSTGHRVVLEADIDIVLIAGRFTLLDQDALAQLLPAAHDRGVRLFAAGVFNSGVLAAPTDTATFDYVPASVEVIARARRMQSVCARYDVPLAAAALQFPLRHPTVASVLTGARSVDEIDENVRLAALELPDTLWNDLTAECGVPSIAELLGASAPADSAS